MGNLIFYQAGTTESCTAASKILTSKGISFSDHPAPEVTDLLLDIPSFTGPGILRSGEKLSTLLDTFSSQTPRIWGGNLPSSTYGTDLLQDPNYLAQNAAITADCALRLCAGSLKTTWYDTKVLVIGWGRIGKSLCQMLKARHADVWVCARKAPDRALLKALGYQVLEPEMLDGKGFHVIFNTAPAPVMDENALCNCPIPMDLASREGLQGASVIHARGLPGIHAPETSGKLIANTILSHLGGDLH